MQNGYVKMWRKLEQSPIFRNSEAVHIFIYLLLKASRTDRSFMVGMQRVELKPGQLCTGRKSISEATGINESKVYRVLELLKSEQQIEQQVNSKFSIISICNWSTYQESEQQSEQQMNNKRTASEQQVNTNKNVKKEENEKKEPRNTVAAMPLGCPHFKTFWEIYPLKKAKGAAEKAWKKIQRPAETLAMIESALLWQKKSNEWTRDNGSYVPHPATYLNQRRWEDSPGVKVAGSFDLEAWAREE